MTALEYMEKQLRKNSQNYSREFFRDDPKEVLNNIMEKMLYYAAAAEALEKVNKIGVEMFGGAENGNET